MVQQIIKVNNIEWDFKVLTSGTDLHFAALEPGSAMGMGQLSCDCAHPSCLPLSGFFRYPFRAVLPLAEAA